LFLIHHPTPTGSLNGGSISLPRMLMNRTAVFSHLYGKAIAKSRMAKTGT
jgi:hypothetical protein